MARKKGRGKGKKKKGKKSRAKMRKFNLDYFGLLTFTRFYGKEFEEFMYSSDKKKQKGFKDIKKKKKKGKKKNQPPNIPKLPRFDALPPIDINRKKKTKVVYKELNYAETKAMDYPEKTFSKAPFIRGGSIRSVMCGPSYPLPPRPQPHGGVYGDQTCPACKGTDHLLKTVWGTLHKKLRKLLLNSFDKAKFVIQYLITKADEAGDVLRGHIQTLIEEFGPIMDAADDADWDDHFEVKEQLQKYRDMQKEVEKLKLELKLLKKNRDAEIAAGIAAKYKELEDAENRLRDLERQLAQSIADLDDWRNNAERKLQKPQDEITRLMAQLQQVRESILLERDNLLELLAWETKIATDQAVKEMEQVIAADMKYVISWMHPAWFRVHLENQKLNQEEETLNAENHLLELEVETLSRQVGQLEKEKRRLEATRIHGIRPPNLKMIVDRYVKVKGNVQLYDYPTTLLMHE